MPHITQKTIKPNQFMLPCNIGLSINIFITTPYLLFTFYHYDTENMSISIGIKNQALFENRYERCVTLSYFGD